MVGSFLTQSELVDKERPLTADVNYTRFGSTDRRLTVGNPGNDGKGIDPAYLGEQGREGHFGLHGMRKRAELIGSKLTIWSALDSGTEVELSIPASHAYAASPSPGRSWLAEKFSAKSTSTQTES